MGFADDMEKVHRCHLDSNLTPHQNIINAGSNCLIKQYINYVEFEENI